MRYLIKLSFFNHLCEFRKEVKIKIVSTPFLNVVIKTVVYSSGALCFGELGAICPKAGGEYQYIKMTYGRMASFANLWVLLIVNSMGRCLCYSIISYH